MDELFRDSFRGVLQKELNVFISFKIFSGIKWSSFCGHYFIVALTAA